jgi:hypothetical protein
MHQTNPTQIIFLHCKLSVIINYTTTNLRATETKMQSKNPAPSRQDDSKYNYKKNMKKTPTSETRKLQSFLGETCGTAKRSKFAA